VLELGCGTGASARWLAHQGWQVTAVDVSRAALQAAAQAAAAEGLTARNPTWLQQDVMRLREPGARAGCQQQQQQSLAGSFHFIYDCQGAGMVCQLRGSLLLVAAGGGA
jgi:SAM-dependent methyltransferase